MVLPAFSIGEPYEAWVRRSKQRDDLRGQLPKAINELSRSRPYRGASNQFQGLEKLLLSSVEDEKNRLDKTLERILQTVDVIPIGSSTIRKAIKFQTSRAFKQPQDSIVYASIIEHLDTVSRQSSCFITQDKDFVANPDIKSDLRNYNCKLLAKFTNGLGYIRNQLQL